MTAQERLTLDEIASALLENDDVVSGYITIIPSGNQSDEDSGEEDDNNVDRLPGSILLSEAEATVKHFVDGEVIKEVIPAHINTRPNDKSSSTTDDNYHTDNNASINNNASTSSQSSNLKRLASNVGLKEKQKKKIIKERNWKTKDVTLEPEKEFQLPEWLDKFENIDPVNFFELFYDDEVLELICKFTNLYALQSGQEIFKIEKEEMRVFLSILLISGYNQVHRLRMYWDERPDTNNKAISDAMSRNRFTQIMKYLHVCDNNNLSNSRFAKVMPLWQLLNEKWLKYFPNEVNLSVDESMIPYYGRHGGKQHMHNKPIRFGYKAWCLCTRLGYVVQSKLYEGCNTGINDVNLGLGGSVVLELIDKLPGKDYSIYFDNFFTSVPLLETLKKKGFHATGTLRANRTERAPLTEVKAMTKKVRGSCESVTDEDSGVTLVRYMDNNVVTMASTKGGIVPISKVKRFSQALKKFVYVDQPASVVLYNSYMGGVDRMDENVAKMRVNIRGKKWYWQLLSFLLNVSVNNAWQLYRWVEKAKPQQLDLLNFTRTISLAYLQKYSQRSVIGRPRHLVGAVDKRVTEQVRFDGLQHIIVSNEKQTRCGQCKKNARMKCKKCNIALHTHCFELFHKKP